MRWLAWSALLVSSSGIGSMAPARQDPPLDAVVSAEWLMHHHDDPDLVILQVSRTADYDKEHIVGARRVEPGGLDGEMGPTMDMSALPAESTLHKNLERLGVSDRSHVIVVSGPNGIATTTRVLFLVRYAGLDRASLLEGGIAAWKRAGYPVTSVAPTVVAGHITTHVQPVLVADYAYVQAHLKSPHNPIVDARTPEYYSGPLPAGMMGSSGMAPGHIPGAVSLPFNSLLDSAGLLLDPAAIRARFRAAGV